MVGWYHRLGGHEFEQAPRDEGQGSPVCCGSWGHKELDVTEQLNSNSSNGRWASLVAQLVKDLLAVQETGFNPWVGNIPWRRKWQSTPVFLPGESHGQRSLVGYSPWTHKELDTSDRVTNTFPFMGRRGWGSPQRWELPRKSLRAWDLVKRSGFFREGVQTLGCLLLLSYLLPSEEFRKCHPSFTGDNRGMESVKDVGPVLSFCKRCLLTLPGRWCREQRCRGVWSWPHRVHAPLSAVRPHTHPFTVPASVLLLP